MIDRVVSWLRQFNARELPCGCLAMDGKRAIYSENVTQVDRNHETISEKKYRNCTKRQTEIVYELQCDECAATWTDSRPAGVGYDFGAENPDAGQRIVSTGHRSRFAPSFEEEPVVENRGDRSE